MTFPSTFQSAAILKPSTAPKSATTPLFLHDAADWKVRAPFLEPPRDGGFRVNSRCNRAQDVAKLRSMVAKAIPGRRRDAVKQFSVFTANRLGRLHDLTQLLTSHNV